MIVYCTVYLHPAVGGQASRDVELRFPRRGWPGNHGRHGIFQAGSRAGGAGQKSLGPVNPRAFLGGWLGWMAAVAAKGGAGARSGRIKLSARGSFCPPSPRHTTRPISVARLQAPEPAGQLVRPAFVTAQLPWPQIVGHGCVDGNNMFMEAPLLPPRCVFLGCRLVCVSRRKETIQHHVPTYGPPLHLLSSSPKKFGQGDSSGTGWSVFCRHWPLCIRNFWDEDPSGRG